MVGFKVRVRLLGTGLFVAGCLAAVQACSDGGNSPSPGDGDGDGNKGGAPNGPPPDPASSGGSASGGGSGGGSSSGGASQGSGGSGGLGGTTGSDPALPGEHAWSARYGDANYDASTHIVSSSVSERIYIAGRFSGSITFGSQTLTSPGGSLGFIAAFNSAGEPVWALNAGDVWIGGLAVDSAGGLLVSARAFGAVNWGSAPEDAIPCCEQLIAGRFSPEGTLIYATTESDFLPNSAIRLHSVIGGDAGTAIVSGVFDRNFAFGITSLDIDDGEDIWLAELDASGGVNWATQLGGDGDESVAGVARDSLGNLYVVGHFDGTISSGADTVSTSSSAALFIAKLSPLGAPIDLVRFETTLTAQSGRPSQTQRVMVAGDGDGIILGGSFDGSLDLGSGNIPSGGDTDGFVARVGTDLVTDWAVTFGDSQDQFVHGIAGDSEGDVWLASTVQGTFDLAGETVTSSNDDILLARIDGNTRAFTHVSHFSGAMNQRTSGLSIDSKSGLVFLADGVETLDLGGGPLTSLGGADVFLAGFGAP